MSRSPLVIPVGRRGLPGATGAPGEGVSTLTPRVAQMESITVIKNIYYSSSGNDSNSGLSAAEPVASCTRVRDLLDPSVACTLDIEGVLNLDSYFDSSSFPPFLLIRRTSGATSSGITMTDANVNEGRFFIYSNANIYVQNMNIVLDSPSGQSMFGVHFSANMSITFASCTFSQTARNTGYLLRHNFGKLRAMFSGSPTAGISGNTIQGVAAGATLPTENIETNITTG